MRLVVLAAAALLGATLPAPTLARAQPVKSPRTVDCLWQALPAPARRAMVAAAPDMDAVSNAVSLDQAMAAAEACGLPETDEAGGVTFRALIGTAMVEGSAARMTAKYRLSASDLEAGWNGMGPSIHAQLRARIGSESGLPESVIDAIAVLGDRWGMARQDQATLLLGYVYGRAMVESAAGL